MIRRFLELFFPRKGWTHQNPYSPHIRKMMEMERLDREQPWRNSSYGKH